MSRWASWIKTGLRTAGVDIARALPTSEHRRSQLLARYGIAALIDVGANEGQYVSEVRGEGFAGPVLSFEPLAAVYQRLAQAANADGRWTALQLGLSDASASVSINIAGNTASSSLLPMARLHEDALPESAIVSTEEIRVARLDAVPEAQTLPSPLLLKVDVQGAELSVLRGASGLMDRVALVEMELSIRELYEGQPLLPEAIEHLSRIGYALHTLEPGFRDTRTGEILQFDGLFIRRDLLHGPT